MDGGLVKNQLYYIMVAFNLTVVNFNNILIINLFVLKIQDSCMNVKLDLVPDTGMTSMPVDLHLW